MDNRCLSGLGDIFYHYTSAEGVRGITGIDPDSIAAGVTRVVNELRFGTGLNPYMAKELGDIFVTPVGPDPSDLTFAQLGISDEKRRFCIAFSRQAAFNQEIDLEWVRGSIWRLPGGSYSWTFLRLHDYEAQMSDFSHIDAALADLASDNPELKLRALEYLTRQPQALVDAVIQHLYDPHPFKYLLFERLGRFGSLAVAPLEQILRESSDRETRVMAATALLYLGSKAGESVLLESVRWGDQDLCVVVRALADTGVESAIPLIEETLRRGQFNEATSGIVTCLLGGLKRLGGSVPEDIRERLRHVEPAWLRKGWAKYIAD